MLDVLDSFVVRALYISNSSNKKLWTLTALKRRAAGQGLEMPMKSEVAYLNVLLNLNECAFRNFHSTTGCPKKKWHYSNYLIVLKPLLKARDYTPGNLVKLYVQLSILKRFCFVQLDEAKTF